VQIDSVRTFYVRSSLHTGYNEFLEELNKIDDLSKQRQIIAVTLFDLLNDNKNDSNKTIFSIFNIQHSIVIERIILKLNILFYECNMAIFSAKLAHY